MSDWSSSHMEIWKEIAYKSAHADPVRVDFTAGCTLHLEGVVEWILLGIDR